jgi:hypothetical protein
LETKSAWNRQSPFFTIMSHAPPALRLWLRLWRALRRSPPHSVFDLLRFRR